jgi:hypothetical protein
MHPNMSTAAFIWYFAWRVALGVVIFLYGLERIEMLDRMVDFATSRRTGGSWSDYFLLDRPDILRKYLVPLFVWWIGGAMIVHERNGTVTLAGVIIFLIAALPWIFYYGFCALTIGMGAGLVGGLLVTLTSILGPLYLLEPLIFFGFMSGMIWGLGH